MGPNRNHECCGAAAPCGCRTLLEETTLSLWVTPRGRRAFSLAYRDLGSGGKKVMTLSTISTQPNRHSRDDIGAQTFQRHAKSPVHGHADFEPQRRGATKAACTRVLGAGAVVVGMNVVNE